MDSRESSCSLRIERPFLSRFLASWALRLCRLGVWLLFRFLNLWCDDVCVRFVFQVLYGVWESVG